MYLPDDETAFTMTPSFRGRQVRPGIDVVIEINSKELRDREFACQKPAGATRILVSNSSCPWGVAIC